jgi:hypothetical protein
MGNSQSNFKIISKNKKNKNKKIDRQKQSKFDSGEFSFQAPAFPSILQIRDHDAREAREQHDREARETGELADKVNSLGYGGSIFQRIATYIRFPLTDRIIHEAAPARGSTAYGSTRQHSSIRKRTAQQHQHAAAQQPTEAQQPKKRTTRYHGAIQNHTQKKPIRRPSSSQRRRDYHLPV